MPGVVQRELIYESAGGGFGWRSAVSSLQSTAGETVEHPKAGVEAPLSLLLQRVVVKVLGST